MNQHQKKQKKKNTSLKMVYGNCSVLNSFQTKKKSTIKISFQICLHANISLLKMLFEATNHAEIIIIVYCNLFYLKHWTINFLSAPFQNKIIREWWCGKNYNFIQYNSQFVRCVHRCRCTRTMHYFHETNCNLQNNGLSISSWFHTKGQQQQQTKQSCECA
jgi:hypothetical protein